MKDLYLMRHGETEYNVKMLCQGWSDSPLTENGIYQAKVAQEYYKKHNIVFDHAYCSSLKRARDTVELVTDMKYLVIDDLKEWGFGKAEGMNIMEMTRPPFGDFFKQYGGEDELECRERMVNAVSKIMKLDNQKVLIVSHGGTIMQFYKATKQNSDIELTHLSNCSILHYQYEDGIFYLREVIHHDF